MAAAFPHSTNMAGVPGLAFLASALLFASIPLYFVKMRDPHLVGDLGSGSLADKSSVQNRTSRWPHTVCYTAGYVALFGYVLSMGLINR